GSTRPAVALLKSPVDLGEHPCRARQHIERGRGQPGEDRVPAVKERERAAREGRSVRFDPGHEATKGRPLAERRHQGTEPEGGPPPASPNGVLIQDLDGNAAPDEREQHEDEREVDSRGGDAERERQAAEGRDGEEDYPRLVAVPSPR